MFGVFRAKTAFLGFSIIRAVVAETTLCTDFGEFGMVVEVSKA